MTAFMIPTEQGEPGWYDDVSGLVTVSGQPPRTLTDAEARMLDASLAARATLTAAQVVADLESSAKAALSDALALADLYPAPTPEETALIDAQVAGALALYRALDNPPADVVSLAAAVVAWRTEVAL